MKSNITKTVMQNVVRFERKRIVYWIALFLCIAIFLLIVFVAISLKTINEINRLQSWDMLRLFFEDKEIIRDHWIEVLLSFWEEAPSPEIYVVGVTIFCVYIWFVLTSKKQKKLRKIRKDLERYEKSIT